MFGQPGSSGLGYASPRAIQPGTVKSQARGLRGEALNRRPQEVAMLVVFLGTVVLGFLCGGLVGATWGAVVSGVLVSLDTRPPQGPK